MSVSSVHTVRSAEVPVWSTGGKNLHRAGLAGCLPASQGSEVIYACSFGTSVGVLAEPGIAVNALCFEQYINDLVGCRNWEWK